MYVPKEFFIRAASDRYLLHMFERLCHLRIRDFDRCEQRWRHRSSLITRCWSVLFYHPEFIPSEVQLPNDVIVAADPYQILNPRQASSTHETPLDLARRYGLLHNISILERLGADPDIKQIPHIYKS